MSNVQGRLIAIDDVALFDTIERKPSKSEPIVVATSCCSIRLWNSRVVNALEEKVNHLSCVWTVKHVPIVGSGRLMPSGSLDLEAMIPINCRYGNDLSV